jgi:hypothetical protein
MKDWEKRFDEEFGIPKKYEPKDRTMSHLKHIFDGDVVGEAIDDYSEQQRELNAGAWIEISKNHKSFIRTLANDLLDKVEGANENKEGDYLLIEKAKLNSLRKLF